MGTNMRARDIATKALAIIAILTLLSGCAANRVPPHLKSLPSSTTVELTKKGMSSRSPIFIRIFKEESELEVWKPKKDGYYHLFKTYPICKWSGKLGPKLRKGDKQAPEGFYKVANAQMNPNSRYHLSFNLGYPNAYDRSRKRTGRHLMVHGNCESKGCYAMTNALMEEIYLLARDAFIGGQKKFDVHAFPFRMTPKNMKRHRKHRWIRFWRKLKNGYDQFNMTRVPPKIDVCGRNYLINVSFNRKRRVLPHRPCPAYSRLQRPIFVDNIRTASTPQTAPKHKKSSWLESFKTTLKKAKPAPVREQDY